MRDRGYDFIRFVSTIMIVLLHFYTEVVKVSKVPACVGNIIARGSLSFAFVGVTLFFMLSGALLLKNYDDSFEVVAFYKKRVTRLLMPQLVGFSFFYVIYYIFWSDYVKTDIISLCISVFGLNFDGVIWTKIGLWPLYLVGEWFTAVIITIYILFPLLRWVFKKYRVVGTILIVSLFLVNLKYRILSGGAVGEFSFTNAIMFFWAGMLFEKYRYKLTKNTIMIAMITVGVLWFANPATIFGNEILPFAFFSIMLFIVLYNIKVENKFIKYICKYNYEMYLVHHRIFYLVIPVWLSVSSNYLQIVLCFVVLVIVTFIFSESLKRTSSKMYGCIFNRE